MRTGVNDALPWHDIGGRVDRLCSSLPSGEETFFRKLEFWIEKSCVTLVLRPLCDRRSHAEIMRTLVVSLWRWASQ